MARGSVSIFRHNVCIFQLFVDHLMCNTERICQEFEDHFTNNRDFDAVKFLEFLAQYEFSNKSGPFVDYTMQFDL